MSTANLQALREERGLTLAELALIVGTHESSISRWEAGVTEPREEHRAAYAGALGITVEQLGALIYARSAATASAPAA